MNSLMQRLPDSAQQSASRAALAQQKAKLLEYLIERRNRKAGNKLADYVAYPKQREFHASGGPLEVRERLLKAGNQVGKTWSAGFEHAMHLTGRYPDWWPGTTFDEPTIGWAASETSQGTRDTVQRILLGQVGSWGTGAIPRDAIKEIKRAAHGVPDAVETVLVRHGGGGDVQAGTSRITIKTYDQGRLRWQGETLDWVWFDEEPPDGIYTEGLTRTNAIAGGMDFRVVADKGQLRRSVLFEAAVLGLLNAVVRPLLVLLTLPVTVITMGLFLFIIIEQIQKGIEICY